MHPQALKARPTRSAGILPVKRIQFGKHESRRGKQPRRQGAKVCRPAFHYGHWTLDLGLTPPPGSHDFRLPIPLSPASLREKEVLRTPAPILGCLDGRYKKSPPAEATGRSHAESGPKSEFFNLENRKTGRKTAKTRRSKGVPNAPDIGLWTLD